MTDRRRKADEVVIARTDFAMQPHQVEPLMVEERCNRCVGLVAVEPESAPNPITGIGCSRERRVHVRHPDDDILRPLHSNGS